MEHLWNDTDRGETNYINLSQCHFFHHNCHMHCFGIEPGPSQREAGDWSTKTVRKMKAWMFALTPCCICVPLHKPVGEDACCIGVLTASCCGARKMEMVRADADSWVIASWQERWRLTLSVSSAVFGCIWTVFKVNLDFAVTCLSLFGLVFNPVTLSGYFMYHLV
jgi:hypothetical protein